MKPTFLSLALLLSATAASAQSSLVLSRSLNPGNCPVALQADHSGYFTKIDVDHPDVLPTGLNQHIHLTVTNLSPHSIVSADITAHGLSQKSSMVPLVAGPPVPDVAKQLNIALVLKGNDRTTHDFTLQHFAAVTLIDVNALTYADGSSWHAIIPGTCSVTPSGLMLVNSAQ